MHPASRTAYRPTNGTFQPRHFPPDHKTFEPHSSIHMGSVLRGAIRMTAAGWIIDKLELRDPLHRTLAFAAAGVGIGIAEKYLKRLETGDGDRKWQDRVTRPQDERDR